ncbi:MAG TPA: hypothetical protein VMT46_07905 [Anaerolineaceae bacterium]|nr:hypothetical protein [Anaerolineaceae bacterium]
MKHIQWITKLAAGLGALLILLAGAGPAFAHGKTEVGDYEIEIGFHNEPALVGEPNSLDLFVTHSKTGEKVNGLEQTLKAELIMGSSKTELPVYARDEEDGAYGADVIPTAPGDYTWHITGSINGTPVDISMTSAPDTFSSVEEKAKYEFPKPAGSTAGQAAGPDSGTMGLIAGLAGVVLGLAALVVALRPRQG